MTIETKYNIGNMTKEDFKKQIEHPIDKLGVANVNNAKEAEWVFWRRLETSAIIARTLRLALRYPDLAQEYLDSLPKATMD
jgi:hypothetical protein